MRRYYAMQGSRFLIARACALITRKQNSRGFIVRGYRGTKIMTLRFKDSTGVVRFVDSQKKYVLIKETRITEFRTNTRKGAIKRNSLDTWVEIRIYPTHVKGLYRCEELPGYKLRIDRGGVSGELIAPTTKSNSLTNRQVAIIKKAQELLAQGMKWHVVQKWMKAENAKSER